MLQIKINHDKKRRGGCVFCLEKKSNQGEIAMRKVGVTLFLTIFCLATHIFALDRVAVKEKLSTIIHQQTAALNAHELNSGKTEKNAAAANDHLEMIDVVDVCATDEPDNCRMLVLVLQPSLAADQSTLGVLALYESKKDICSMAIIDMADLVKTYSVQATAPEKKPLDDIEINVRMTEIFLKNFSRSTILSTAIMDNSSPAELAVSRKVDIRQIAKTCGRQASCDAIYLLTREAKIGGTKVNVTALGVYQKQTNSVHVAELDLVDYAKRRLMPRERSRDVYFPREGEVYRGVISF